jgi:mRNA interferase RelE/StbE
MPEIRYTREAQRTLARIPTNTQRLIDEKIEQYARDPGSLSRNLSRLQGRPGFRLRVGDWRIIFDQDGNILTILDIGPRGGIYD